MRLNPSDLRLQKVIALHRSGKISEAVEGLQNLLVDFPDSPPLLTHLGTLHLQQNNFEQALKEFEKASAPRPNFLPALTGRAQALEGLGRLRESLENYDQAIALKPEAWLYFNRGNVLRDLGRLQEAVESYGSALKLNPKQVEALNNQGALFLRAREPLKALENFNQTVSLRPADPDGFNNRGNAFRFLGKPQEALKDYDRAISLNPGHADSWNNRGIALQELSRLPEAVENYDKAIALKSDFAFAYWNKSQARLLQGEFEEGWKLYEWRWNSAMKNETRNFAEPLWLGDSPLSMLPLPHSAAI